MNLKQSQDICEKINNDFKNKGLNSKAEFKNVNNKYSIFIRHFDKEILPSYCNHLKKIPSKSYVKQGPRTPSSSGKWIDKPMSPANRHVDGPSAIGGPRRIMDIQDVVRTFANKRNKSMDKIKKVVKSIKRLASLDRNDTIDNLIAALKILLTSEVYSYLLEKTKIREFLENFENTYNIKDMEKVDNILEKDGIKKNHKMRLIIKEIIKELS